MIHTFMVVISINPVCCNELINEISMLWLAQNSSTAITYDRIPAIDHHFLLPTIKPSRKPRPKLIRTCAQFKWPMPIDLLPCVIPLIHGPPPNSRKATIITTTAITMSTVLFVFLLAIYFDFKPVNRQAGY